MIKCICEDLNLSLLFEKVASGALERSAMWLLIKLPISSLYILLLTTKLVNWSSLPYTNNH